MTRERAAQEEPRVLMLGKGWFPADIGGLDRYYRELLEHLPGAEGVVVGPGPDAPPRVAIVSHTEAPLVARLRAVAAATRGSTHDVVDAHFALYAFWPVVLGALRRTPLVVHFQGPWADENVAAGDASGVKHAARRRIERAVYRRASTVVTLTGAFRRVAIERYGVSPWRVRVERPGVDLQRFVLGDRAAARTALELPQSAFVAVCVRRLTPRMGLEVLLDAWEGVEGTLLIAGDGPLREALAARIAGSEHLRARVRLLGRVPEAELLDLYRAADMNVVPTRSFEGFGLVVLEAAACGTPSIVTDAGGLREANAGAPGGEVVPAGDVAALRAALTARPAVDRGALRAWAERSAWPVVAARHRTLYREAATPPAARDLRVIVLDHVARLSGGEIALLRLLPHLEGVHPHVVLAEDGPLADRLDREGVSVQILPLGAASRELRKAAVRPGRIPWRAVRDSAVYVARLAWLLRREQPDVVHANSLKAGLYGGFAAKLAGVPLLWHLHDRLDPDYLPPAAVRLMRLAIARLATTVVTNSHSTAETLRGTQVAIVVPSALPAALPPPHVPRASDALTFGIVGRLTPWKGQHVFLEAFARAFPEDQHRAVLVGAPLFGEEAYEAELRQLVARLGIAERVTFRGFREDIWAELAELDVLVHASTSPEPFGQVVQEGMALGLPVIAADAGGPAEFVRHGENGLLITRNDPVRLIAPMRRLAADIDERTRLGRAARASVTQFAPEVVAAQMRAAYLATQRTSSRGT